jgi:uncharacterized 2Fe-2S/4Fe-4S cluster protein (DUF4445 family)
MNLNHQNTQNRQIIIDFEPISRRISLTSLEKSLYEILMNLEIRIRSECGGQGTCGKCKVRVQEGGKFLNTPASPDLNFFSKPELQEGWRLACQTTINQNKKQKILQHAPPQIKIYIPETTLVEDFNILTSGNLKEIKLNPEIKKKYVNVDKPSLEKPVADLERLIYSLFKIDNKISTQLDIDYELLRQLPHLLRESNSKVTATLWKGKEIIDLEPNNTESNNFGIAFDIGTTTIVGYLINLTNQKIYSTSSKLNPQTAYGEDLITRMTYIKDHDGGLEILQKLVLDALNEIINETCREAGIEPSQIYEVSVVGNSVMHHIFLGLDPMNIGLSPYTPVLQKDLNLQAKNFSLNIAPHGKIYTLPLIAGFVGADTMGVILSSEIYNEPKLSLAIDIGTNGEIIVGNKNLLLTGSCAAGSALEGAHIKYGMRAAAGSIDRVKIDPDTLETTYTTIKRKKPLGICGSGLIDAVAEMLRAGILYRNGNFNKDLFNHKRFIIKNNNKEFIIAFQNESLLESSISISLDDIRQIQMAKAAFYSGTRVILNHLQETYHKSFSLQQIFLAGAFGNYINKENARFIGMIPDINLENIYQIGNAAGVGAQICLMNKEYRTKARELLNSIHYVEIAVKERFQREYAEAMYFPHMNLDLFPKLKNIYKTIPKR